MVTKGRSRRLLSKCIARASTPLPVPLAPAEQHRHVRLRGAVDDLQHRAHRRRARIEIDLGRLGLQPILEADQLGRRRALRLRLLDQVADLRGRERLGQVVPGAAADRLDGGLDRRVGRDHDDDEVGVLGEQLGDQVEAALLTEAQIQEHEIEGRARHRIQRRRRGARLDDRRSSIVSRQTRSVWRMFFSSSTMRTEKRAMAVV